jgi:hypothetical protein
LEISNVPGWSKADIEGCRSGRQAQVDAPLRIRVPDGRISPIDHAVVVGTQEDRRQRSVLAGNHAYQVGELLRFSSGGVRPLIEKLEAVAEKRHETGALEALEQVVPGHVVTGLPDPAAERERQRLRVDLEPFDNDVVMSVHGGGGCPSVAVV